MTKILITGGNGNLASIIKTNLTRYNITNCSRNDLNILNIKEIEEYLNKNKFDILIHTAILGGRRTKEEKDVTHHNLLMFENLLRFSDRFKMIIQFDSAAIYDRNTDILNRKEDELFTVPTDYYGFSKYVIYQRSLQQKNVFNFRIFNIFHVNEEKDRFIKSCFLAKKNNTIVSVFEDKYFDFMYEDDFVKIVNHYLQNINNLYNLPKTINICYEEKHKLSEIARFILQNKDQIKIENAISNNNYTGDGSILKSMNLNLCGLKQSLERYHDVMN
jgi:GDP-L-fucose synthase